MKYFIDKMRVVVSIPVQKFCDNFQADLVKSFNFM